MEYLNKLLDFFIFYVFKRNLEIFDDIRHHHKVNRNQALLIIQATFVLVGSLLINFATPEALSWIAKIFEQALDFHNTIFLALFSQSTVVTLAAWLGLTIGKQGLRRYYNCFYHVTNSDHILNPIEINTISIELYVYLQVNEIDFVLNKIGPQDSKKLFMDDLTKKYLNKIIDEIDKTERLLYGTKDSQEKEQFKANKTKLKGILLAMRPPDCQFDKLFKWIKITQVELDIKREKVKQALKLDKEINEKTSSLEETSAQSLIPNVLNQFPQTTHLPSISNNPLSNSPNYGSIINPIEAGQGTKVLIQEKILQKSKELANSIPELIEQKNICKEILSDIDIKPISPLSPS